MFGVERETAVLHGASPPVTPDQGQLLRSCRGARASTPAAQLLGPELRLLLSLSYNGHRILGWREKPPDGVRHCFACCCAPFRTTNIYMFGLERELAGRGALLLLSPLYNGNGYLVGERNRKQPPGPGAQPPGPRRNLVL